MATPRNPSLLRALTCRLVLLALALAPASAGAEALRDRFSAGGYFRIMTRPDFQGGDSKLGYWPLYGRLLNEGPWGGLELKLDMLQNSPGRADPWASVFAKIEGGSFANTDYGRGNLGQFAASQLYVQAGNILLKDVTWQLGTIYHYFGDLGLYDFKPADLFWETVGLSARYDVKSLEVLVGLGDSGFGIRGGDYSTIPTLGGSAKLRLAGHFELGVGGQYRYEPQVPGNRRAPYATPGVAYEDFLRKEVVRRWLEDHPGQELLFPYPDPRSSQSYKLIGYLGFGGFGPLQWSNLFANFQRMHPNNYYTESYQGREYQIFVHDLTDDRYQVNVGNQMQLSLVEDWLDAVWAVYYGHYFDLDNEIAPSSDVRDMYSTVLRLQLYATRTVHLLAESSIARETSPNGNAFRDHADSIFRNTGGIPDARGLEMGDSDHRDTWQLKTGVVLNPTGPGVFTRPSLRLLYGLQYSTQQAAYGNAFVETMDQYNIFKATESHWHSVVAIEAEAWF